MNQSKLSGKKLHLKTNMRIESQFLRPKYSNEPALPCISILQETKSNLSDKCFHFFSPFPKEETLNCLSLLNNSLKIIY